MVCFNSSHQKQQCGGGIIDSLMKPFPYEKFKGERHAYSLAPSTFMKPMNFMGPGTRLDIRLNPDETPKQSSLPLNNSDYQSYLHDLSKKHAKEDYLKKPNTRKQETTDEKSMGSR